MDDVRDDIIISRPFEIDPHIFGFWHKYFGAIFVIATRILMLTALVIYVAHRYRRTSTVHPMFPITMRNVVFFYATS